MQTQTNNMAIKAKQQNNSNLSSVCSNPALRLEWDEYYKTTVKWIICPHCGETAVLTLPDKVIECRSKYCSVMNRRFKFGAYRYDCNT